MFSAKRNPSKRCNEKDIVELLIRKLEDITLAAELYAAASLHFTRSL